MAEILAAFDRPVWFQWFRREVEALGKRAGQEYGDEAFGDLNDGRQRIGNQDRAQGRAAYDEKLGGLHEHHQVAVLHEISTDDGTDNDDYADDCEHVCQQGRCRATLFRTIGPMPSSTLELGRI
ncbi:MAG TPA: hypothetical protein VNH83_22510 [Bryobacteraceae bacterium]|nr:hypothetical protein [Bryobacteraceae bacterium]